MGNNITCTIQCKCRTAATNNNNSTNKVLLWIRAKRTIFAGYRRGGSDVGTGLNLNRKEYVIIIIIIIIIISSSSSSSSISSSNIIAPAVDSADMSANFYHAACAGIGVPVSVGLPSLSPLLLCRRNDGEQRSVWCVQKSI